MWGAFRAACAAIDSAYQERAEREHRTYYARVQGLANL